MDENFGEGRISGTDAIAKLRSGGMTSEVIISCSGNTTPNAMLLADAVWGKPYPDWKDGTMLQQLVTLLDQRTMDLHANASSSVCR